MRQLKKLLALLLALATVCSTLSVTAWASDVAEIDDPDAIVGEEISEEDENLASPSGGGGAAEGGDGEGGDAQTPDNAPDAPDDNNAPAKAPAKVMSTVDSGTYGDLKWTLDSNGTLIISGKGEMPDNPAWKRYGALTICVVIENGVTSVRKNAFYGFSDLTSVTIPNSVTSIGDFAFYYCTSLTSVTIPNGVKSIGNGAFKGCTSLTSVTIPNSVTSIKENSFDGTPWQEAQGDFVVGNGILFKYQGNSDKVAIPNGVTSIGDHVFEGYASLTSVTIPDGVKSIGDCAFFYCTSLTSVTLPNSVTSIGDCAFYYCTPLTSVTIPNGVTSIGEDTFGYCTDLISVTIPSSVTSIGDRAFYTCASLTNVTIPSSVTSIGEDAFETYSRLTISGYTGSAAETYAKNNGIAFKALDKSANLFTPALPTLKTASNGISITWSKVSGAEKYRVYRKTGNGAWQKLGDTTGTTWTDRTAEKGKTYSYTICCVSKDGKTLTSDYNKTGKSATLYLATPAITTLQSASGGVIINWGKVSGAAKYRVFRRAGNGNWERVADVTDTRAVDRTAKKGTTYTYTVRCISSDSKTYTSDFNKTGKSIKYGTTEATNLKTPAITNLQNASGGIIINWGKVSGATRYRVFRRVGNGNWERVADVTDTRAVDRTAKKGVTYTYTIRCISSDGKTYTSSFNSTGWTIKR